MSYSDFQLAVASIAPFLAFRGCLTLVLVMWRAPNLVWRQYNLFRNTINDDD